MRFAVPRLLTPSFTPSPVLAATPVSKWACEMWTSSALPVLACAATESLARMRLRTAARRSAADSVRTSPPPSNCFFLSTLSAWSSRDLLMLARGSLWGRRGGASPSSRASRTRPSASPRSPPPRSPSPRLLRRPWALCASSDCSRLPSLVPLAPSAPSGPSGRARPRIRTTAAVWSPAPLSPCIPCAWSDGPLPHCWPPPMPRCGM